MCCVVRVHFICVLCLADCPVQLVRVTFKDIYLLEWNVGNVDTFMTTSCSRICRLLLFICVALRCQASQAGGNSYEIYFQVTAHFLTICPFFCNSHNFFELT